MGFPVECTLAYNPADPSTHVVIQTIFKHGQAVYNPRPKDGRRIVDFSTREMQEEAIRKGPPGFFVIPTDEMGKDDEKRVRAVVEDVLREHGLISRPIEAPDEAQSATTQAVGLARERGIDLATIQGTGEGGKITKGDVEAAVAAQG